MLEIHKIAVPTPYPFGPTNSYLIRNRPYTLVDPGPETAEAQKSLLDGLASLGVTPADIARVVITHSDSDHSGLARWLSELSGATIYVHKLEVRKFTFDYDYYQERLPFLREAGLPFKVLKEILEDFDPVVKPLLPRSNVEKLEGGEVLDFKEGSLQVLHLPGHSGGHICLYDPNGKYFLAGDFILKRITPNPIMESDPIDYRKRLPTLTQYLKGLEVLKKLDIRVVLTGHGEYIVESREAAIRAQKHHSRRLETISSILDGKSLNTYQVMRILYPRIKGFHIYLGISEIFAHLDYLLAQGKVHKEECDSVSFYRKSP